MWRRWGNYKLSGSFRPTDFSGRLIFQPSKNMTIQIWVVLSNTWYGYFPHLIYKFHIPVFILDLIQKVFMPIFIISFSMFILKINSTVSSIPLTLYNFIFGIKLWLRLSKCLYLKYDVYNWKFSWSVKKCFVDLFIKSILRCLGLRSRSLN